MSAETATLHRDEVKQLHYVYVYRGNGDGGVIDGKYCGDDSHPLDGKCICHHAVWHSCPAPSEGKKMFDKLPTRPIGTGPQDELAALRSEVASLRRRVADLEGRRR